MRIRPSFALVSHLDWVDWLSAIFPTTRASIGYFCNRFHSSLSDCSPLPFRWPTRTICCWRLRSALVSPTAASFPSSDRSPTVNISSFALFIGARESGCDFYNFSLSCVRRIDLCGPEGAAQAIGFLLGLCSVPLTVGPPIAGLIYDQTKSYKLPFILAGIPALVGASIMTLIHRLKDENNEVRDQEQINVPLAKPAWNEGKSQ